MLRQSILLFALFVFYANANAEIKNDPNPEYLEFEIEKLELEGHLFGFPNKCVFVDIESIEVYEVEEEVELNVDLLRALMKELEATESDTALLSQEDLLELDEFLNLVDASYDSSMSKNYLVDQIETLEFEADILSIPVKTEPVSVNKITVYEVEEEVDFDFDTSRFLPEGFNANKSIHDLDWNTIDLYEVEEDIDLNFDTLEYLPKDFNPYQGMVQTCDDLYF